jgi:hypothetical protein
MPTNTQGTTARQLSLQTLHVIRKTVTFADNGVAVVIGVVPAGAQIVNLISGVYVQTAFNAGTTNVLDIGISTDDDVFATDLALGTRAFVAIDEAATATGVNTWLTTADVTVTATVALAGTAATAGSAVVQIVYSVDNDAR